MATFTIWNSNSDRIASGLTYTAACRLMRRMSGKRRATVIRFGNGVEVRIGDFVAVS